MKELKSAVTIRSDCLYCPLCLQIDSYWGCSPNCPHCVFRRLNRTWGKELRKANPVKVYKRLMNGKLNRNPKSSLAFALHHQKTLRIGSKSDPYQPAEVKYKVTRGIIQVLIELDWSFVIQTRFTENLMRDEDVLAKAHDRGLLTLLPVISPGGEADWELLERRRTTPVNYRLRHIKQWIRRGWNVGVNGEPFIPGHHSLKQFEAMVKRLKKIGVRSYNTYNLHANDLVYKNLAELGLNVGRIYTYNQNSYWSRILMGLCNIAKEQGIILGSPDWFNVPKWWVEKANTCCGVDVPNPSRYNTHYFRLYKQKGKPPKAIARMLWEGIGDRQLGHDLVSGKNLKSKGLYDMSEGLGILK